MDEEKQRHCYYIKSWRVIPVILGMTLFFSCKQDIEKVTELPNITEIPAAYAEGVEIIYSDSSIVRIRIEAPELKEFPNDTLRPPQIDFPQGLTATFYNSAGQTESVLTARYAIFLKKEEIFEARDKVLVRNYAENQQLETDQLFWDRKLERIWSQHPVLITTPDGITRGTGFSADQNFTWYALGKPSGTMAVKEETGL